MLLKNTHHLLVRKVLEAVEEDTPSAHSCFAQYVSNPVSYQVIAHVLL